MIRKVVFKYELDMAARVGKVALPQGAQALSIGVQRENDLRGGGEVIVLWALVDPREVVRSEDRRYALIWTGLEAVPHPADFVGTVQTSDGLVWHLFLEPGEEPF